MLKHEHARALERGLNSAGDEVRRGGRSGHCRRVWRDQRCVINRR
jgi:hypothetical protein